MRQGGRRVYEGDKVVEEEMTQEHPEGNRPRDASGQPLNVEVDETTTRPKPKSRKRGQAQE